MKQTKPLSILSAALVAFIQFGAVEASAEARYDSPGFTIDSEAWLDDSVLDPIAYFVYGDGDKSSYWSSKRDIRKFFYAFNEFVDQGVLNELDVLIVWHSKFAPVNADLYYDLGISRNTYFDRLRKIRYFMRTAYNT